MITAEKGAEFTDGVLSQVFFAVSYRSTGGLEADDIARSNLFHQISATVSEPCSKASCIIRSVQLKYAENLVHIHMVLRFNHHERWTNRREY